jgi:hypothetical protein
MAKIEGVPDGVAQAWATGTLAPRDARSGKAARGGKADKARFRETLEKAEEAGAAVEAAEAAASDAGVDSGLEAMLDAVHELGGALARNPSAEAIDEYKRAVRRFMRRVVEESWGITERTSGMNVMKRKKYVTVEIVDRKLERLAADLISTQRGQLDILARVEEIQGLLVDLTG